MKKLKLNDRLVVNATANDGLLNIDITDTKSGNVSNLTGFINECKFCGANFISDKKLQICPRCDEIMHNFCNDTPKNAENNMSNVNVDNRKLHPAFTLLPYLKEWVSIYELADKFKLKRHTISDYVSTVNKDYPVEKKQINGVRHYKLK